MHYLQFCLLTSLSCLVISIDPANIGTTDDICSYISHTAFQLQLQGALATNEMLTLPAPNLTACSNMCCRNESCVAALFAEINCTLINCPYSRSPSCQPVIATKNDIDPNVLGKNTTLLYIKKRFSFESDLVSSKIFDLVQTQVEHFSNSSVDDSEENQINKSISINFNNSLTDNDVNLSATNILGLNNKSQVFTMINKSVVTTAIAQINGVENMTSIMENNSNEVTISTLPVTTDIAVLPLHVIITGTTEIQLPNNSVILHAKVKEKKTVNKDLKFKWTLIAHPNDYQGEEKVNANVLSLESLKAGEYHYKVEVTADIGNAYGEAFANITVKKPVRINKSPVAVISPTHQEITLPHDVTVLDGSSSFDDDEVVSYFWRMKGKPLTAPDQLWTENTQSALELAGLVAGEYEFELTVTDSDGASNSTTATVTVNKKIDEKPRADAGGNRVIHMPENSITLYANNSKDDYGIVSYKWALSTDSPNDVVDLQGARTSQLHLSNFEAGQYIFRLTVTDASDQEDTASVTVSVLPESNHPPIANAGQDQPFFIPIDGTELSATLDGSQSSDDKRITGVEWHQVNGPMKATITNRSSIVTTVTGLSAPGNYIFLLTVSDEEEESNSDSVTIIVKEIQPPVADAGRNQIIHLPDDVIILDGINSHDEYGIKSYSWSRSADSPATGYVVNGSDLTRRLVVSTITEGTYNFTLTVTNIRGKDSSDNVIIQVLPNPHLSNLVELHLRKQFSKFSEAMKEKLSKQIALYLSLIDSQNVNIQTIYTEHRTGHLVILFYVEQEKEKFMLALNVVTTLNSRLQSESELFGFDVLLVDTYVCENNCSRHGLCHAGSKLCECDTFWMQNFFRYYIGDGKSNCDWSVLYVVIIFIIILGTLIALTYAIAKVSKRKRLDKKSRYKRRKKYYTPLIDDSREKVPLNGLKNGVLKNGLRKGNNFRSSSFMRSMTSSSDEDNTVSVFEKQRLIKSTPNKRGRAKKREKHQTSNLIDINTKVNQGSDFEFDGLGLDKTPVKSELLKSSDELV